MKERVEETMWRTMKILPNFTADELRAHIAITRAISPATANRYCKALEATGYLKTIAKRNAREGRRFSLITNSGAHAPKLIDAVFDPNTGEIKDRKPLC